MKKEDLLNDDFDTFNLLQFIRSKLNIPINELFLFIQEKNWNDLSDEFEKFMFEGIFCHCLSRDRSTQLCRYTIGIFIGNHS